MPYLIIRQHDRIVVLTTRSRTQLSDHDRAVADRVAAQLPLAGGYYDLVLTHHANSDRDLVQHAIDCETMIA